MLIRPLAVMCVLGETGRPASKPGGNAGPAAFFSGTTDTVSIGGKAHGGAGLYSASPLCKIIGAVELVSSEAEGEDWTGGFGERPVLI